MREQLKKYALPLCVAALVALLAAGDLALAKWAPVERSTRFRYNDYESELCFNGGATHERVIFGGDALSAAMAGSETGWAVFDLSGGTTGDLAVMLEQGYLLPTAELCV